MFMAIRFNSMSAFLILVLLAGCGPSTELGGFREQSSVAEGEDTSGPLLPPPPSDSNLVEKADCEDQLGGEATASAFREEVCLLTNQQRQKSNLLPIPLALDAELSAVAQAHAEDMVKKKYFGHTSGDGKGPGDRLRGAGIKYAQMGENIAKGQSSPAVAMNSWMSSNGHRANIMSSRFRKVGVGVHEKHWVQIFTD